MVFTTVRSYPVEVDKDSFEYYQFAFNRITRRRGGMKKAEAEVEAKKFLNLNLDLNLFFPGSRMKANWYDRYFQAT